MNTIVGQSGGAQFQWMAAPEPLPGVPRGLEYLSQLDHLIVVQQIELLEGTLTIVCFLTDAYRELRG